MQPTQSTFFGPPSELKNPAVGRPLEFQVAKTAEAHSRKAVSRGPIARMQRLHELLISGRYPNCRQLSTELEVSSKTIFRDLEFMRDQLKLPIQYDQKLHGHFYAQPVECPIALALPVWEFGGLQNPVSPRTSGGRRNQERLTQLVSVRIWFDARIASEVVGLYPTDSRNLKMNSDGSVELTVRDSLLNGLDRWILTWGVQARVIEPRWLRDRVMKIARAIVDMYRIF